jgi:RNA polymerase sigma-70 factor (ECF subfamily)
LADIIAGMALPDADQDLVEELRAGSERAFTALLSTYEKPIYNFVYRLLDDASEAPDVTQEVFLKVFRNIGEFRGECSMKTWIYRIAVNEASNLRRWFSRHRRHQLSLDEQPAGGAPALAETLADQQENQYDRLLRQERMQVIERALAQVPDNFRVAVVLRDLEGLSYDEIAEVLEISVGTVKSRILRGREALKQKLAGATAGRAVAALQAAAVESAYDV